ncbi:MAG: DNA-binding protein [Rhodocyclales bacterium]|nr:MAG: DNA-binding protein [Rhodocyclales bacterium]
MTDKLNFETDRLTRKQAAEYLGLKESTLCFDASTHRLAIPYYKIGARVFYRRSELDTWIAERRIAKRRPRSTLTAKAA